MSKSALEEALYQNMRLLSMEEGSTFPLPERQIHFDWCCEHPKRKHLAPPKTYATFCALCEVDHAAPTFHEYRHGRKWAFDFAWPALKFAAEVEGGHHRMFMRSAKDGRAIAVVGHHQHDKGYQSDLEKYNRAAELGWMVLRFSQRQVTSGEALNQIERSVRKLSELGRQDSE